MFFFTAVDKVVDIVINYYFRQLKTGPADSLSRNNWLNITFWLQLMRAAGGEAGRFLKDPGFLPRAYSR